MIDLTPLEVRKKKGDFKRVMRGYEPPLVDDFLDLVADRMEELVRENLALSERVGRQDQAVTDYRDRERALTEALVTAQEMREEMRRQTEREAELARRTAEQEVTELRGRGEQEVQQLRAATLDEVQRLRASAQEEAQRLRREAQQAAQQLRESAEREAQQLRAAAEREAAELRSAAQRESAELRATTVVERERQEEMVRRLRGRQHQYVSAYRDFLERELAELSVFERAFEESGVRGGARSGPAERGAADEMLAAGAAGLVAPAAGWSAGGDFDAPGDDPGAEDAPLLESSGAAPADVGLVEDVVDLAFVEYDPAAEDVGVLPEMEAAEPFAPEPFQPDEPAPLLSLHEPEPIETDVEVVTTGPDDTEPPPFELSAPTASPATPEPELDAELQLYEGVAEDTMQDGIPGPIGLDAVPSRSVVPEWDMADLDLVEESGQADPFGAELPLLESDAEPADALDLPLVDAVETDDEADAEMSKLLENAEIAGYRLSDLEREIDELLLDEETTQEDVNDGGEDDDGWLPTLLDDENK